MDILRKFFLLLFVTTLVVFWQKELLSTKEDAIRYEKLTKNNETPIDLEKLKPHRVGLPIKYLWFCLFDIMKNDYKLTLELLREIEQFLFVPPLYPPAKKKIINSCAVFIYYNGTEKPITPLFELDSEGLEKEFKKLQKIDEFNSFYLDLTKLIDTCVQSKNEEIVWLVNEATERKTRIILRTGLFTLLSIGFLWYRYHYNKN